MKHSQSTKSELANSIASIFLSPNISATDPLKILLREGGVIVNQKRGAIIEFRH